VNQSPAAATIAFLLGWSYQSI